LQSGGFRVAFACDVIPLGHSLESTTICVVVGIVRQKIRDAQIQHLVRSNSMINISVREVMGAMLLGEANRKAPAQAELRPTCAGPAMSKR
jgi:hypothetical protein